MRDTQKAIPGLTSEREKGGNFSRVEADLTKPDSIAAAVKTSGAKRAFVYLSHTPDNMKATFSTMKSSGVEFVVFLSSSTIAMAGSELRDVQPSEVIPYMHAQAEVSAEEVFGEENFVALRPGYFATNTLRVKAGIAAGEVEMIGLDYPGDFVTPNDMGEVAGTILALGPKNGQHVVYLYGPQVMLQRDATQIAGRILGKDVKLTGQSADKALEEMTRKSIPKPLAEYLLRVYTEGHSKASNPPHHDEGVENIKLYTGRAATGFEDWVQANKELFAA